MESNRIVQSERKCKRATNAPTGLATFIRLGPLITLADEQTSQFGVELSVT